MSVKIVNSDAINSIKSLKNKKFDRRRNLIRAVMVPIDYTDTPLVNGREGYVWCRDRASMTSDSGGVFQAFNPSVKPLNNRPVWIEPSPRAPYRMTVIGYDYSTLADSATYVNNIISSDVALHGSSHTFIPGTPSSLYSTDVADITERNISAGRVYATTPVSMTCNVAPVSYVYTGGVQRFSGGVTQDFTANIPAAAGEAELDYICVNETTNLLAYVRSSTFAWTTYTDPLPPAAHVVIPEGYLLLGTVLLYNGMTSIVERNFTYEIRPIFSTVQDNHGVSDTASGTIITLGDNAGATALIVNDSDDATVWQVDSNGNVSMDDGTGDSPELRFIGGSNDDIVTVYLDDDAAAGKSDLVIELCDAAGESKLSIQDSGPAEVAKVDSNGNAQFYGTVSVGPTPDLSISYSGGDGYIDSSVNAASDLHITTGAVKTLVLDTPVYDDLRVPITATKLGGTKDPGFTVFKTNGAGSQGVFIYWFDPDVEEELYFTCQMPHGWDSGTIYPHVHWTPEVTSDGNPANQTVEWGLEYTWTEIGGDFGNTSFVYGKAHSPADADVVADRHYMTSLTSIAPSASQDGISSMLICRLFRNATDATDDTYEQDAGLLEIDFHYTIDKIGSRQEGAY